MEGKYTSDMVMWYCQWGTDIKNYVYRGSRDRGPASSMIDKVDKIDQISLNSIEFRDIWSI